MVVVDEEIVVESSIQIDGGAEGVKEAVKDGGAEGVKEAVKDISTEAVPPDQDEMQQLQGDKAAAALGVVSKLGGRKSLWKMTEERVVDAYKLKPEEEEHDHDDEEHDDHVQRPKFQLSRFKPCKVGLIRQVMATGYSIKSE